MAAIDYTILKNVWAEVMFKLDECIAAGPLAPVIVPSIASPNSGSIARHPDHMSTNCLTGGQPTIGVQRTQHTAIWNDLSYIHKQRTPQQQQHFQPAHAADCPPVVALDDVLEAFIPHELPRGLHAVQQHLCCQRAHDADSVPVVAFDDVLKAFVLHELHGGLHAVQQGQDGGVRGLPILVGLDHVLQVVVHPLQLGLLAHLQSLHTARCYGEMWAANHFGLDHVFQVVVDPFQLGLLAHLQSLHTACRVLLC